MNPQIFDQTLPVPEFDQVFLFLNQFILELAAARRAGSIQTWATLDKKVKRFFTPARMQQMEKLAPGWIKMSSYSAGITLTHVICVFLGIVLRSEFQGLTHAQQQMTKWIVLFHDLDKIHLQGKKDPLHGFRSAVLTAQTLPSLGFSVTGKYQTLIAPWSEATLQAFREQPGDAAHKPDNDQLPAILTGIDELFGEETPASQITKTVLLHISLAVDPFYPTPAPLTEAEIKRFISPSLLPLLKIMYLGDNEGWSLFDPEARERQARGTLKAFEAFQKIISGGNRP